jgi:peptidoglycan hydrolase-like protein with peptidoglycan-binding domain
MILGLLTLITALSISAVAIYYSVAGLVAIFAAAALPIMIMGGTLEIAKLVTAVWLHRYWSQATWWLKTYLTTAVVVLMFITSMGIFGFLSKAHIEQTSASEESIAKVEVIQKEINRQQDIISRAESRIQTLENSTSDNSADIQAQIDKEQERIDSAYTRIQPAIQEQNEIIAGVTQLFQQELDRIDEELAKLQGYIDTGDIEKAQGMVGTKVDGDYGPKTAAAFTAFQDAKRAERNEWLQKIQNAANSPTVVAARDEIARLRNKAEQQIADSNTLINRLRDQLGNSDNADEIQKAVDEQNERVRTASLEIDTLTEEKIVLEAEYRKLEAEVGPIKYIAEFIYGDTTDNNMLEEAVRWVIITIIFVFDPLAVLLLIASQYTFEYRRKDDSGGWLRQYEQARAQRIVDNPGFDIGNSAPPTKEEEVDEVTTEKEGSGDTTKNTVGDGLAVGEDTTDTQRVSVEQDEDTEQIKKVIEDVARTYITTDDSVGDVVSEDDTTNTDASVEPMEQPEVQTDDDTKRAIAKEYAGLVPGVFESTEVEKKDIESSEGLRLSEEELNERESLPEWQDAKTRWKQDHPNLTLKTFKQQYLDGKIDTLPWEDYIEKKTYIMKNKDNTQVKKETKPELTEVIEPEGYIQNAEQNESTLWKKLNDGK